MLRAKEASDPSALYIQADRVVLVIDIPVAAFAQIRISLNKNNQISLEPIAV
jgi:hypothetical protein